MLKIEKTVLPSSEQWEIIIEGMRNPMNSWDKMDSEFKVEWIDDSVWPHEYGFDEVQLGDNDHDLMTRLAKGGPVHGKYRRMIPVFLTINAPLYWWKEFDTYKVGTVCNSCSTMHKIHANPFTMDDFSHEHLIDDGYVIDDENCFLSPMNCLREQVVTLNMIRNKYFEVKNKPMKDESKRHENMKRWWWQLIQLLPTSYNQKRTIMLNYEVLVNIYHSRKNHKLDEWRTFCDWIEKLPYSELITGDE